MSFSSWLRAGVAGAALLCAPVVAPTVAHAAPFKFHYDHVLGTSLDITVLARDEASAMMAATAAKREIARLDAVLSAWRPDAELSRLNAGEGGRVSPELFDVLSRCEAWRQTTNGAFDCRMGGPLALWRAAQISDISADALERTLAAAQADAQADAPLNAADRTISRPAGLQFTVDGFAKGYIVDAALRAARDASPQLAGLMVDIGGDLRCWGRAPQAAGWRVGVAVGEQADNASSPIALRLGDKAVAFSGRGARDIKIEGCAVSHTLAPTSGRPQTGTQSAVVLADSAADADALATAFMVMAPHEALALADRLEGVEAFVTGADGATYTSANWSAHVDHTPHLISASLTSSIAGVAAASQAATQRGLEVTYQVPKIDADPYHAPYLAMWITDQDHKLVKTLLLLGQKPKWAPENYVWWRRYGRETPAILDTVARPSRAPGRYTAHWDGGDEAGKPAAAGKYILHVEASREKGGHTYETSDIALGGPSGAKTLPAKDELGPLELRY
jgi:thiamine biosynthesis lipoprotein